MSHTCMAPSWVASHDILCEKLRKYVIDSRRGVSASRSRTPNKRCKASTDRPSQAHAGGRSIHL